MHTCAAHSKTAQLRVENSAIKAFWLSPIRYHAPSNGPRWLIQADLLGELISSGREPKVFWAEFSTIS